MRKCVTAVEIKVLALPETAAKHAIKQEDNYSRKPLGYLPVISVKGINDPVIRIVKESTGETVYSLRIKGDEWRPKVFEEGKYTVIVSDGKNKIKKLTGLQPSDKNNKIELKFN
jgi:hypothetical protein